MSKHLLARIAVIALLWIASFAVVPPDWDAWISAPLRVYPYLDPTAGVIGISTGAFVQGALGMNWAARMPNDVESHRLYAGLLFALILASQVIAAVLTGRTRVVWIAPIPFIVLVDVVVPWIYMRTSPYSIVAVVGGWRDLLGSAVISYFVGVAFLVVALKHRQVRSVLVHRTGLPGRP